VLLFFVLVAFFQALGLTLVAQPLNELLTVVFSYIPKLFAALVIALIAWIVAVVLKKIVLKALQKTRVDESVGSKAGLEDSQAKMLAHAARISILVFAGAMALRQMGLANEIINLAFGLLLGAMAVAVALAFGLGGREIAAREIEKWLESMK